MAAGVMAITAAMGRGVGLGADHGDTARAVVPALHVAPSESRSLGAPEPRVGEHGQDVGGEGAGLALGFGQPPAPSLRGGPHARVPGRGTPASPTRVLSRWPTWPAG